MMQLFTFKVNLRQIMNPYKVSSYTIHCIIIIIDGKLN